LFSSLQAVVYELIALKVSPMSASKLLELVNDDVKSMYLKIELAAFVEVLFPLRKFCYAMEGDGDLAFAAGERADNLFLTYPDGNLPETPSANQLINQAVEFIQGTIHERPENIPVPQHRTAADVAAAVPRPRRAGAAQAVRAATFVHKTAVQRQQREEREVVRASSC
jgi:hypothetical protein